MNKQVSKLKRDFIFHLQTKNIIQPGDWKYLRKIKQAFPGDFPGLRLGECQPSSYALL